MSFAQHILIATDFSMASRLAVRAGGILAQQNDARVTLVHVVAVESLAPGEIEQAERDSRDREVAVHEHLDRLREEDLSSIDDVKTVLLRGSNAASSICQLAQDADVDMVVIATHGRTGVSRFLIGSVAEKVVRHAPCPVLTLRSKVSER